MCLGNKSKRLICLLADNQAGLCDSRSLRLCAVSRNLPKRLWKSNGMSESQNTHSNLVSIERLKQWTDTVKLQSPMREYSTIPYLYQFSLNILKEGLVHVLAVHRRLAKENETLNNIRKNQYSDLKYQQAFRFVDYLALLGTPGLEAEEDLWMEEQCMSAGAAAAFYIRGFSAGPGSEGSWKTGQMLRHSIELFVRLNCFVRESSEALKWAIGVAQGDVEDKRLVEWWMTRSTT